MAEDTVKVLAVGGELARRVAESMFPDAEIDVEFNKISKKNKKKYDIVLSWNTLMYIPFDKAESYTQELMAHVAPGGQMVLYVVAMEWIAEQILDFQHSNTWRGLLFGSQKDASKFCKNGFTLIDMRNLCFGAGAHVISAETGSFVVADTKVGNHLVICHVPEVKNAQTEEA